MYRILNQVNSNSFPPQIPPNPTSSLPIPPLLSSSRSPSVAEIDESRRNLYRTFNLHSEKSLHVFWHIQNPFATDISSITRLDEPLTLFFKSLESRLSNSCFFVLCLDLDFIDMV